MSRTLPILALVVVAAAAAVLVNVALLRAATSRNDPVGKLSPRVHLPAPPPEVIRPHTGPVEGGDDSDDD